MEVLTEDLNTSPRKMLSMLLSRLWTATMQHDASLSPSSQR